MNLLDKNLTLSLNASWYAIGHISVRKAIVALCSESDGEHAALGMDITMAKDESGQDILVSAIPTNWEDWINLPVREGDLYIQAAHSRIRVPTVIISRQYNKIPMRRPRLGKAAIAERDGYICQYSGEKLTRGQGNIDHIIPRDRGGRDTWENLVWSRKDINSRKGNKLNHEAGLKLIRAPKAPAITPVIIRPDQANHETWLPFLMK